MNTLTKQFERSCPQCGITLYHTCKYHRNSAQRKNTKCKSCGEKAKFLNVEYRERKSAAHRGKVMAEHSKQKISTYWKEYYKTHPAWNKGTPATEETKKKMSASAKNRIVSEETKRKLRDSHKTRIYKPHTPEHRRNIGEGNKGKTVSEATKTKIRIALILNMMNKGYATSIDPGHSEWFNLLKSLGYNFQCNKPMMELGYIPDGYDPDRHIIMEIDSPMHLKKTQIEEDRVRQYKICKYFEDKGEPLSQFVRVKVRKNGMPYAIHVPYQNPLRLNVLATYDWANV